jgi:hypothetical protein
MDVTNRQGWPLLVEGTVADVNAKGMPEAD